MTITKILIAAAGAEAQGETIELVKLQEAVAAAQVPERSPSDLERLQSKTPDILNAEINRKTEKLVMQMLRFMDEDSSGDEDIPDIVNKVDVIRALCEIEMKQELQSEGEKTRDTIDDCFATAKGSSISSGDAELFIDIPTDSSENSSTAGTRNSTARTSPSVKRTPASVKAPPITTLSMTPPVGTDDDPAIEGGVKELWKKIMSAYPAWNNVVEQEHIVSERLAHTQNGHNDDTASSSEGSDNASDRPTYNLTPVSTTPRTTNNSTHRREVSSNQNTSGTTDKNVVYINEVRRALNADSTNHPPKDSPEYFKAAERYALYGNDFEEFPPDFSALYEKKSFDMPTAASTPSASSVQSILGDGLYPTPTAAELAYSLAASNYAKPYGVSTFAGTTYYHHMGAQQNWRQNLTAAANTSTIGMFLNANKLSYMPTQVNAANQTHLVYNQQTAAAANAATFISNSLANAALASSPLIYTNALAANNAQNYLQNWYQKQPYVNNQLLPNAAAVGFYERLLYAQALQKQIYNYQTRAVAMALYQQQQQQQQQQQFQYRPPRVSRSTVGGFTGTPPTFYGANNTADGTSLVITEVASATSLSRSALLPVADIGNTIAATAMAETTETKIPTASEAVTAKDSSD